MFYFLLAVAGAVGVLSRYLLGRITLDWHIASVPLTTIVVNVIGSFLMGYLSWLAVQKWQLSKEMQTVICTGLLGGFTTFSAFSLETVALLQQGLIIKPFLYVLFSVVLCVLFCALGIVLARYF